MKKLMTAAAVFILLTAGNLQAAPQYISISPQNDATLGRFESDADYYNNVRNYNNMDFAKWWGVVSYQRQRLESPHLAQLGFAARIGNLFTSFSYRGNGFLEFGSMSGGTNINTYNEQTIDGRTWKIFSASPELDTGYLNSGGYRNEAHMMFGIADMGFLIYYASNFQKNNQEDYAISTGGSNLSYYKSYSEQYGSINPGIIWGMTKEIIPGRGVKPQVNIDLDFRRFNKLREDFWDPENPDYDDIKGKQIDRSENVFVPSIDLGLYGFNLFSKNNFSLGMDISYGLKLFFYKNDYSYENDRGYFEVNTLKGGYVYGLSMAREIKEREHTITPFLGASWKGDRLGLVGRIGLPMTIHRTDQATLRILTDGTGSLQKHGTSQDITEFSFIPRFELAMQWEIIPSRLSLNAGARLRVFLAEIKSEDRKVFNNGEENPDDDYNEIFKENRFNTAGTNLYIGLTFNITKNLELQAAMGVDSGNNLNVFGTNFTSGTSDSGSSGGLINFGNILLALKF